MLFGRVGSPRNVTPKEAMLHPEGSNVAPRPPASGNIASFGATFCVSPTLPNNIITVLPSDNKYVIYL